MPGFYTNRSKSYDFNLDYIDFPVTKSIVINDDVYFFGSTYAVKNSFFTTSIDGQPQIGPRVDGYPEGITSDGYGGFFLYGQFAFVNEKYRRGIAHFNSSGQLTEWNAGLNGSVYDTKVIGTNVYIGGAFSAAKGVVRESLAALSLSGQLLTWNPSASSTVYSMAVVGDNIYIGGFFTSIGGTLRSRLAAINTLGSLLTWGPSASSSVIAIEYSAVSGALYVGGSFLSIDANVRRRIGSISLDGTVQSWNPSASGTVRTIDILGSNIYFGGDFTSVNGNVRNYLAAADVLSNVLSWNPNVNGSIYKLFVDKTDNAIFTSNIYISGTFGYCGGQRRNSTAVVNTNGDVQDYNIDKFTNLINGQLGFLQKFNNTTYNWITYESGENSFNSYKLSKNGELQKFINVDGPVRDAVNIGDNIYIAGSFERVGGSRSSLATFSTSGNDITNFFINNDYFNFSRVNQVLSIGGNELYIVGSFQNVNGQIRTGIAHVNSSGNLSNLNVDIAGGEVRSVSVIGSNIYFGGEFTLVNGNVRNYLAAVNTSGSLLDWNPSADFFVYTMAVNGNDIYIGGDFVRVNGNVRNYLAAINTTGNVLTWNPSANNSVYGIIISQNTIFTGGAFTLVNGNARGRLAAIDTSNVNAAGNVLTWNPSASGNVRAIAISGTTAYVGGTFTSVTGNARNYVAAINTPNVNATANILTWNPSAGNNVFGLGVIGNNIYIGGYFITMSSSERIFLAAVNTAGSLLSWNPYYGNRIGGSNNTQVLNITTIGTNIYAGWNKSALFGTESRIRYSLAAVNTSGSILNWNPNVMINTTSKAAVNTITASGTNIYIGGSFSLVNGVVKQRIAALNTSGSLITWPANQNETLSGTVNSMKASGSNIYIGGDFVTYGVGSTVKILKTDNSADPAFPVVDTSVYEVLPDGTGGYYIGGTFTSVNGNVRNRLAYINSSGAVTAWNPSADNGVYALGIIGTSLYVGGVFTSVNGNVRNRLAAINTVNVNASGNVLAWNPSANGYIIDLAIIGNDIYVTGDFTLINGNARNYVAAINTTGNVIAWNPGVSANVDEYVDMSMIKASGTNIYIGGHFTQVAASVRYNLALVNTAGTVQTWNPNVFVTDPIADSAYVYTLELSGSNIYIGGHFDLVSGTERKGIAAVNTLGSLLAFNPNARYIVGGVSQSADVYAMSISGDNVYFGGYIDLVSGFVRKNIAAVNTSGNLLSWNPRSGSHILSMNISGTNIYIGAGGNYPVIGGTPRSYLAAINTSGNLLAWNPSAADTVNGLIIDGNNIYAYGLFTNFGTVSSYRAIGENSTESVVTSVFPEAVMSIAPDSSGGVYIGGAFTWVDGVERNRLAHINSSGAVTPWNPNVNGAVDAILISGTSVYIGGEFTSVFSNTRNRLAALSTVNVNATGNVLAWNPNANNTVYSMGIIGVNIYIGGAFTSVNNNVRNRLAAVNTTANVVAWNPSANANVYALAITGDNVYVGGEFTLVNGNARGRLAGINTVANVIAWAPSASSNVFGMGISGSNIYIGGDFTVVNGLARNKLVGVNTAGTVIWNPSANGNIYAVAVSGANVYVGGDFTLIGGNTRNDLAALDATSAAILSWNPSSSAIVCALAVSNATVYIGTTIAGTTVTRPTSNYLGMMNTSSSTAALPKINLKKSPTALAVSGSNLYVSGTESMTTLLETANHLYLVNDQGKTLYRYAVLRDNTFDVHVDTFATDPSGGVYIGGEFDSINGMPVKNLAYINSLGSVQSWNPKVNGAVYEVQILGDNIYISGQFTTVGGLTRSNLAAVSSINVNASGNVLTWNPSSNGTIYDIAISNNIIYVGGEFTLINGNARSRLAAVNTSGNVLSWNPSANGLVAEMEIIGTNVYVGGEFTIVNGLTRNRLVGISTFDVNATGNVLAWNPSANLSVYAMDVSGTNVYVGGNFSSVAAVPRTGFAVIDTAGSLQPLNVEIIFSMGTYNIQNSTVSCIKVDGNNIYVSGLHIQAVNGQRRPGSFAVNTSGSLLGYSTIGQWSHRLHKFGDKFFAAASLLGGHTIFGGDSAIPNFVTLDKNNLLLKSINIDTDEQVNDITVKDQSLIFNSRRQVFDGVPSYRISDERQLNAIEQGLE